MSPQPFRQIEPTPWPSGRGEAVAVIELSPETFAREFGLRFFDGSDNLDLYVAAALRLPSGRQVGLLRHAGNPAPGTELHVDAKDDVVDAIREFIETFGLTADELPWVREDVPMDHLRAAAAGD